MSQPNRGAFIVVEGLDRAGKTTQVARLVERLKSELGLAVEGLKFPDRTTTIGQNLNAYLTSTSTGAALPLAAAHLLFSANRWEAAESLSAKLRAGTTLVVDRYSFSGAVYTTAKSSPSAKDSPAGTFHSLDWTWSPEVGLPQPDLLVFLDIDAAEAARRGGFGDERYETNDMQQAVRRTFYELLGKVSVPVARVDAGRDMDSVGEDVWQSVKGCVSGESTRGELLMLGPLRDRS